MGSIKANKKNTIYRGINMVYRLHEVLEHKNIILYFQNIYL